AGARFHTALRWAVTCSIALLGAEVFSEVKVGTAFNHRGHGGHRGHRGKQRQLEQHFTTETQRHRELLFDFSSRYLKCGDEFAFAMYHSKKQLLLQFSVS